MSMAARRHVAGLLRPLLRAPSTQSRSLISLRPSFAPRLSQPAALCRSFQLSALRRSDVSGNGAPAESASAVTNFKELGLRGLVADSVIKSVVDDMNIQTMTPVQVQTINPCLDGTDLVAQAKTGTGKTLGFLVPVVQRILAQKPELATHSRSYGGRRGMAPDIRAIIISPTRELAEQIAVEAKKIVRHTGLKVQTAVGGTQKRFHLRQLQENGCHILVGTPGRLYDILSDPDTQVRAPNLDAFVLDEADRLLDAGFAPEITRIHDECLPRKDVKDRQTLMFSATMPKEVVTMVRKFMRRDFKFVQTVAADETPTHEKVPQRMVQVAGMENMLPTLMELIRRESQSKESGRPFKAMVFFNSNAEVIMYNDLLQNLTGFATGRRSGSGFLPDLRTTHMTSRLSQRERSKNSDFFRKAKSAIMLTSNVTARGMDFPDVTHVISFGLPDNRESYIHRIGRTGRGEKSGEAWILLSPVDSREARYRLKDLPIEQDNSLKTATVDMTQDGQVPADAAEVLTATLNAVRGISIKDKAATYKSSLGVYQWADKKTLIAQLNNVSKYCWGMQEPPRVESGLAAKLGLSRIPGINIGSAPRFEDGPADESSPFDRMSRSFDRGDRRDGGSRFQSRPRSDHDFSRGGFSRDDRDRGSSFTRGRTSRFGGEGRDAPRRFERDTPRRFDRARDSNY